MSVHDHRSFQRPAKPIVTSDAPEIGQALAVAVVTFVVFLGGLLWALWP